MHLEAPSKLHERTALIIASLTFINGVIAILGVYTNRIPEAFVTFLPFDPDSASRLISVVAGLTLIYFSFKLRQGKHTAWLSGIVILAVLAASQALRFHDIFSFATSLGLLAALIYTREHFQVRSDSASIRQGFTLAMVLIFIALLYGTVGFAVLEKRDFGKPIDVPAAFVRTVREYTLIGNSDLRPRTREARWFYDSLDTLGLATAFLVVISLFRPVRFSIGQLAYEHRIAERLVREYGTSSDDFFKLWPRDKHFFFNDTRTAFIAFKVVNGVALVVDDPTGKAADIPKLTADFMEYCRINDWLVSFIHCAEEYVPLYQTHGLDALMIGQEAIINLPDFIQHTARDKHFRYVHNKFSKAGFSGELLTAPQTVETLEAVKNISKHWLKTDGRKERGFMLGYFDAQYISDCDLYVVRGKDRRIVAFTNLLPANNMEELSVDLMRYNEHAPNGIMNFLFLNLLQDMAKQGAQSFNLGLAPLSGIEEEADMNLPSQLMRLLKQFGGRFYSFSGLQQFKNKFDPAWQKRYIAYQGGSAGLVRVSVALNKAMRLKTK